MEGQWWWNIDSCIPVPQFIDGESFRAIEQSRIDFRECLTPAVKSLRLDISPAVSEAGRQLVFLEVGKIEDLCLALALAWIFRL